MPEQSPASGANHDPWFCEHCCRQLVVDENPLREKIREALYFAGEALRAVREGAFTLPARQSRTKPVTPDHEHVDDQLCEKCLASFHSLGNKFADNMREFLYVTTQVLTLHRR